MVALAVRKPAINSAYEGLDVFGFQIEDGPPSRLLGSNCEDPAILSCPRHILLKKMLYKTADGRQSTIARGGGVPTMRFDVVQEREHSIRLDVIQTQVRHWSTVLLG